MRCPSPLSFELKSFAVFLTPLLLNLMSLAMFLTIVSFNLKSLVVPCSVSNSLVVPCGVLVPCRPLRCLAEMQTNRSTGVESGRSFNVTGVISFPLLQEQERE